MTSPYVRRYRLSRELKALRTEAGMTHDQLAKAIGQSRPTISRLENGHGAPDQEDVLRILEALGVDSERWDKILTIANEAGIRGWWENHKDMGQRQALYADLEAGAVKISEYQQTFFPGLVQIPEFTRVRVEADWAHPAKAPSTKIEGIIKGRAGRQRMLNRPGGMNYEVIMDEDVVRRLTAPRPILRAQLLHLAAKAEDKKITVRLLPVAAEIDGFSQPPGAYSIYQYADPEDPTVVAIEAFTTDIVLTEPDEVNRYVAMFDKLRRAALPPEASLEIISQAARQLTED